MLLIRSAFVQFAPEPAGNGYKRLSGSLIPSGSKSQRSQDQPVPRPRKKAQRPDGQGQLEPAYVQGYSCFRTETLVQSVDALESPDSAQSPPRRESPLLRRHSRTTRGPRSAKVSPSTRTFRTATRAGVGRGMLAATRLPKTIEDRKRFDLSRPSSPQRTAVLAPRA